MPAALYALPAGLFFPLFLNRPGGPSTQRELQLRNCHFLAFWVGLFAAADGLGVGHVSGVPRYISVRRMPRFNRTSTGSNPWNALQPFPKEAPQVLLRVARFPESTFRGAVRRDGMMVADVIQVWLDVLHHPTRGQEQAEHISRKVLRPLV